MFRSIVSQSIKKSFDLQAIKLQFTTLTRFQHQHSKETTKVKIIGTIATDPCALQTDNNTRVLTVETKDSNSLAKSSIHNIHTNTQANLAAGQRIYIIGRLMAHKSKDSSGKDVTSTIVRSLQLFVLENKSESGEFYPVDRDLNSVQLNGSINTDIVNMELDSTFSMACNYKHVNENGEKQFVTYTQPILTIDQTVCRYLRDKNVENGDKVLVYGQIAYKTMDKTDGTQINDCIILATNISKIAKNIDKIKK